MTIENCSCYVMTRQRRIRSKRDDMKSTGNRADEKMTGKPNLLSDATQIELNGVL